MLRYRKFVMVSAEKRSLTSLCENGRGQYL
jgi:hypothetical protein